MFGNILQELRLDTGLTQEELSKILKISRPVLSKYETGENEPNLDFLVRCSEYFDVSIDYLLCKTKIPTPQNLLHNLNNHDTDTLKKLKYILFSFQDKKYIEFIYSILVATKNLK